MLGRIYIYYNMYFQDKKTILLFQILGSDGLFPKYRLPHIHVVQYLYCHLFIIHVPLPVSKDASIRWKICCGACSILKSSNKLLWNSCGHQTIKKHLILEFYNFSTNHYRVLQNVHIRSYICVWHLNISSGRLQPLKLIDTHANSINVT